MRFTDIFSVVSAAARVQLPDERSLFRGVRINIDKFDQSLRNAMDALGVGYCYMIKRRGNILHLHASGWAQVGTDGPISWAPHIPMNMASVSKFVTAIAVARLFRDSGMSLKT